MKTLKTLLTLILFTSLSLFLSSCSDDDNNTDDDVLVDYTCDTCSRTPDALAIHDSSIKGMYKGIFVGSTGSISINIQNGVNTITVLLVIDDISIALTSAVEVVEGEPYVAPFTGIYNGQPIAITFSVGIGGSSPTMISSDIPGHPNAVFVVVKETSTSLIEAFEGTYATGNETGTFNIILSRAVSLWGAIAKKDGTTETSEGDGTINGSNQLVDGDGSGRIIGTITEDVIQGSFVGGDGTAVALVGYRTL